MLATLLIVFREVIEAGLIVGIVLAATRGVPRRGVWVSYGILGGVIGAALVAAFASQIAALMEGFGQELFNVAILLAAVCMLTWHNVWMARHGRELAVHLKHVGDDVSHGKRSLAALSIVVGIAVLREGAEIVLFLYGIAVSGNDTTAMMALGALIGLVLGGGLGTLTYLGLLRIPNRHLFTVTSWLIALLAAGMAAKAVALLQQADVITSFTETVWNSSHLLSEGSVMGTMLHTLIGYTDQPSQMQLIVYVATLALIFTLMRLFGHSPTKPAQTAAA